MWPTVSSSFVLDFFTVTDCTFNSEPKSMFWSFSCWYQYIYHKNRKQTKTLCLHRHLAMKRVFIPSMLAPAWSLLETQPQAPDCLSWEQKWMFESNDLSWVDTVWLSSPWDNEKHHLHLTYNDCSRAERAENLKLTQQEFSWAVERFMHSVLAAFANRFETLLDAGEGVQLPVHLCPSAAEENPARSTVKDNEEKFPQSVWPNWPKQLLPEADTGWRGSPGVPNTQLQHLECHLSWKQNLISVFDTWLTVLRVIRRSNLLGQAWWLPSVLPALRRTMHRACREFPSNVDYIESSRLTWDTVRT